MSPNAYYNFLKDRKAAYRAKKEKRLSIIQEIYHKHQGKPGYRMIKDLDTGNRLDCCLYTVHRYMKQLGLKSVVAKHKPKYVKGTSHKKFDNLLKRNFVAAQPNQKWCTDFTYLKLTSGATRYNCSILDLYDRSIVATLNGKQITAALAIETVKIALAKNPRHDGLMLHSDQGSQFTSKEFTDFCAKEKITQSMSKAGCPYDNAPMESFYGTLKNEYISQHHFRDDESLNKGVYQEIYCWYNHVRPHSFNHGKTPFMKRCA